MLSTLILILLQARGSALASLKPAGLTAATSEPQPPRVNSVALLPLHPASAFTAAPVLTEAAVPPSASTNSTAITSQPERRRAKGAWKWVNNSTSKAKGAWKWASKWEKPASNSTTSKAKGRRRAKGAWKWMNEGEKGWKWVWKWEKPAELTSTRSPLKRVRAKGEHMPLGMRIVRAKNRVVPAYPQVRLSPATLDMLASRRPVMKPRAEVAAHLLSPDQVSWPRSAAAWLGLGSSGLGLGRQPTRGVVTFRACGGLTNQRLVLLDGLMIAALLNFTAVAPQLNVNGRQAGATNAEPLRKLVDFGTFFDGPATARALRGVPELLTDDRGAAVEWAEAKGSKAVVHGGRRPPSFFTNLAAEGARHISLESCTLNTLDKRGDASLEQLFWRIDAALVPAPAITDAASRVIAALRADSLARGGNGAYTALHMRVAHCKRLEDPAAGDNCLTNTDNLDRVFAIEGVPKELPVYVAVVEGAPPRSAAEFAQVRGLRQLADQGYALCGKRMLLAEGELVGREREWLDAVDFAVSRAAARVVGNSVSKFSALQLLRRQHEGADHDEDDFHYNGGDIPLAFVLWGAQRQRWRPLKWVFTIHSSSSNRFNEMARVAVASALQHTTLIPVCIFYGQENAFSGWMRRTKGVRFVAYKPQWRHKLKHAWEKTRALTLANSSSTNYKSLTALLATHLRIDIPVSHLPLSIHSICRTLGAPYPHS
jgi:hypothetical protein